MLLLLHDMEDTEKPLVQRVLDPATLIQPPLLPGIPEPLEARTEEDELEPLPHGPLLPGFGAEFSAPLARPQDLYGAPRRPSTHHYKGVPQRPRE